MNEETNEELLDKIVEAAEKEPAPFELIVGGERGEITNGDVPVRWCVTPELVKQMEDAGVKDPHVLLVTATPKAREMHRQLIPLTELKAYVRFYKAGEQKLYGFIINGAKGRRFLHSAYLQKTYRGYNTDIFCTWDERAYDEIDEEFARTEITLDIPANVFGKEPSPWMKWYVNLWHPTYNTVDECHYRKRWLLAFSIKWIFVIAWAILYTTFRIGVAAVMSLGGYFKQIEWKLLLRPYKWHSMDHVFGDFDFSDSFFFIKREQVTSYGAVFERFIFFPFVLNPLILTVLGLIYLTVPETGQLVMQILFGIALGMFLIFDIFIFLCDYFEKHGTFGINGTVGKYINKLPMPEFEAKFFKIVGIIALVGIVLGALFLVCFKFELLLQVFLPVAVAAVLAWIFVKYGLDLLDRFDNFISVSPAKNDYTEIRELLCPRDKLNLSTDTAFIPPEKRTIRLWYNDMKNKVCKPMQR